jgi:hypothetical protein
MTLLSTWKARLKGHPELRHAVLLVGFGLFLMPFLIYLAGALTLGGYEHGLTGFLGNLYYDFLRLRPAAWALLLGPYALFWALRLITRPLRRGS